MKFRKKPVVIDAFKYGTDPKPLWFTMAVNKGTITIEQGKCIIHTLEGKMEAPTGNYIVRGVRKEMYSVEPNIFHETYEKV